MDQLESFKGARLKEMQTQDDEMREQLMILTNCRLYVEELVEKGSACAISQSAKDLLSKMEQMETPETKLTEMRRGADRVRFEPSNMADSMSDRTSLIGWIAFNGESQLHWKFIFENYPISLK